MSEVSRETLFETALALPPTERAAYLERACADNSSLRDDVASLLAAHEGAEAFFDTLAKDAAQSLHQTRNLALQASRAPDARAAADEPLTIGEVVAHYRVDARLGQGGMGVVYRATDLRLDRQVALKVLPNARDADSGERTRLLEEARSASALDHPHIGTILDVGTIADDGRGARMYVAMVYYDSETLADRLTRGPVSLTETLRIGTQLASALAAAHRAGIVHRDVKPSNVLLASSDGSVRLVDFGIAVRVGDADAQEGMTRAILAPDNSRHGTPRYMSPERVSGAPPDPRSDVWSFGLLLRKLTEARPRGASDSLPPALEALIERCLDPDPSRRPAHAGDVLIALEAVTRHTASRESAAPRMSRLVAGSAGLAALLLFGLFWQNRVGGATRTTDTAPDRYKANRVLVLPFENISVNAEQPDAELSAFGLLAADHVTEALAATSFAEAVPALTALALTRDGSRAPRGVNRVVHLAQPVGASWVLDGNYLVDGDSLLVRATLLSGRDGRVIRTLQAVRGLRSNPGVALSSLAEGAVVTAALELDPRLRSDPMLPAKPPKWDAYEAYAKGKEHFLARRYVESLEALNEAYARDSSFRLALFYRGMIHVNMGQWAELESIVAEYRRRQSARSDASERVALRLLEAYLQGDHAASYRVHREAEAIGMIAPGGLGHFSLGAAALDLGRPREMIRIVRQSDPDRGELKGWSSYWEVLARAHIWLGEYDAALDAARRLQRDHPHMDLGLRYELEVLAKQGRVAAADSVLEVALRGTPDAGALLRFAGSVLQHAGHEQAARRAYLRSIQAVREALERGARRSTPALNLFDARAALGESLVLSDSLKEAEKIFRELAREFPQYMDPPTALGTIAARRGDAAGVAHQDSVLRDFAVRKYNRGRANYRRARLAALQRDGARAATLLSQAWKEGYSIYFDVWTNPDFAGVMLHPAMRALLAPQ